MPYFRLFIYQGSSSSGYGTHNQPEGTWSDDTSMTSATCMSTKNKGCVDLTDIRNQFEKWLFNNEYTPFHEVFDCGNTCLNNPASVSLLSGGRKPQIRY